MSSCLSTRSLLILNVLRPTALHLGAYRSGLEIGDMLSAAISMSCYFPLLSVQWVALETLFGGFAAVLAPVSTLSTRIGPGFFASWSSIRLKSHRQK